MAWSGSQGRGKGREKGEKKWKGWSSKEGERKDGRMGGGGWEGEDGRRGGGGREKKHAGNARLEFNARQCVSPPFVYFPSRKTVMAMYFSPWTNCFW